MNKMLYEAFGEIDERYLAITDKQMEKTPEQKKNRLDIGFFDRKPVRRAVVFLAAALALALCSSAIAFAANEDFRESVKAFFHITAADKPLHEQAGEQLLKTSDNSTVKVSRIKVPENCEGRNGFFYWCTDEIMRSDANHYDFYELNGGELALLEKRTTKAQYTANGKTYDISVEWASNGEKTAIGYVQPEEQCIVQLCDDKKATVIVILYTGSGSKLLTLSLPDGVLTDLGESFDLSQIETITEARMSPFGTCMIIGEYEKKWCAVFDTGELISLDELCGASIDAVGFVSESLITCQRFQDNAFDSMIDSLVAFQNFDTPIRYKQTNAWTVDINTGETEKIYSGNSIDQHELYYIMDSLLPEKKIETSFDCADFYKGRYMLEVKKDEGVFAVDLLTGSRLPVSNVTPEIISLSFSAEGSPDGKKVLFTGRDQQSHSINSISVIDFEKLTYTTVDIDLSGLSSSTHLSWFDNDTVKLVEEEHGMFRRYYWYYLYTFE